MPFHADQLSRMIISGYKSIKKCDINFGKINVLIGSNGAGKSNFISAFSLLQNILSQNLQVSVAQSGVNALLYNGRKVTEEIAFEVYFGLNSYGFDLIPADDNRLIFRKEYFGYSPWKNPFLSYPFFLSVSTSWGTVYNGLNDTCALHTQHGAEVKAHFGVYVLTVARSRAYVCPDICPILLINIQRVHGLFQRKFHGLH